MARELSAGGNQPSDQKLNYPGTSPAATRVPGTRIVGPPVTVPSKNEISDLRFLIHDLRVDESMSEIIHFHTALDTDLELYGADQAKVLHGQDLESLREKAAVIRRAYQSYSNAVKNYSPENLILVTARKYVEAIYDTCELVLCPLWGRTGELLDFLPRNSRSAAGRGYYETCIGLMREMFSRIRRFFREQNERDVYHEFDIAAEIEDYTLNFLCAYARVHSGRRIDIELNRLEHAVLGGNLGRFRRMYSNLALNAADAVSSRTGGVVVVSDWLTDKWVTLSVMDNGVGMTPGKIDLLLNGNDNLDNKLHSVGFVFVRQTVRGFGGDLSIESELNQGTKIAVRLPRLEHILSRLETRQ